MVKMLIFDLNNFFLTKRPCKPPDILTDSCSSWSNLQERVHVKFYPVSANSLQGFSVCVGSVTGLANARKNKYFPLVLVRTSKRGGFYTLIFFEITFKLSLKWHSWYDKIPRWWVVILSKIKVSVVFVRRVDHQDSTAVSGVFFKYFQFVVILKTNVFWSSILIDFHSLLAFGISFDSNPLLTTSVAHDTSKSSNWKVPQWVIFIYHILIWN